MELLTLIIIIIVGIGAIVAGILCILALIYHWWWLIPILCALAGGWIGFFFGIGLDVVIWVIIFLIASFIEGNKNETKYIPSGNSENEEEY